MTKVVYMLYEEDGRIAGGPYLGAPDLDFPALMAEFRTQRYAKCEAASEDYCFLTEDDFASWLLERGVLSPMKAAHITVNIDTSGANRYIPGHWPTCPECGAGRGDQNMGRVLHSLNRCEWYFKCTECDHTWDHHDEPYDHKNPMLEDDGRCIESGCVPYSISQVGGLPMPQVLKTCQSHGWSEDNGMPEDQGIEVAQRLGLRMIPGHMGMIGNKLTLRRLLDTLSPRKSYIVATRGHWLAVVNGINRDQGGTNMRTEVTGYWEVQRVG